MAFPVGWSHYTRIIVQSSKVAATHSNFSFPIELDNLGSTFWGNVDNGGGDIRVTLDDGTTQVPCDVIVCNTSTEVGQIRVLLSSLSSSVNTPLKIWHGKPGESLPAAGSTYGQYNAYRSEIEAAWPHEENPFPPAAVLDRTANTWHGTNYGGLTAGNLVAGKLGNAIQFEGGLQDFYHMLGSSVPPNGLKPGTPLPVNGLPISISMMINFDATGSSEWFFVNDSWSINYYGILFGKTSGNKLQLHFGNGGVPGAGSRRTVDSTTTLSASTWYHIVGVIPATSPETTMKIYVNGVDDTGSYSGVGSGFAYSSGSFNAAVGGDHDTNNSASKIEEVKFWSGFEIDSNWASTLSNAEYDNPNFFTVDGSYLTVSAAGEIRILMQTH